MTFVDSYRALRDRLINGETVTTADVLELAEIDAQAVLTALHVDLDADRATAAQAEADRVALADLLVSFEAEADRVTDRLAAAAPVLDAAVTELLAASTDLDTVVRVHCDALRRLGWSVSDAGEVVGKSAGRIIIDRDQLPRLKLKLTVPDPAPYVRWARQLQAERDAR